MECNVVRDLIPLYIDECCSKESAGIVKAHMATCAKCKALYESMKIPSGAVSTVSPPAKPRRVNDWRASVLQSVLLFLSFALITVGVALEAATPAGGGNGCWAVSLIVPATGFMLSLANWYFVRLYQSRKRFSNCSLLVTLGITACGYLLAGVHYKFAEFGTGAAVHFGIGILLTAVCCVLSKVLSNQYAGMLGKE